MKVILFICFTLASASLSLASECGLESSASRIYKGDKVKAHKYPWLAHIRSYEDRSTRAYGQCGGSLIDEQTVATAAHCVVGNNNKPLKPENIDIYLGKVTAFSQKTTPFKLSKVWVDSKYKGKDLAYDFALLTLEKPVAFNGTIAPICLPKSERSLNHLVVSGWGTTSAGSKASDDLLEVDVTYMKTEDCRKTKAIYLMKKNGIPVEKVNEYALPKITPTHMCAINKKTMGDACSGDSGGPLMHKNADGRWVLMGVVSGSWTDCGESPDTSGLYTRTSYYKDILRRTAKKASWQGL